MYKRKTIDLYVIKSNYGHGWEDTTATDDRRAARADLKAYRENQPEYPHRLVCKREKIATA